MWYIRARKCKKGASSTMYTTTECEFNMGIEDVRFVDMKQSEIEVRRSSRASVVSAAKVYDLDEGEIETLKQRCWEPLPTN
jgi:hypothetical protein